MGSRANTETKWVELMRTPLAGGALVYYRTKGKGGATPVFKAGYGYYCKFIASPRQECRTPLQLLPFIRKKIAEIEKGTMVNETYNYDTNLIFKINFETDGKIVFESLNMQFDPVNGSRSQAAMTLADLKKFTVCLEVLGLLTSNQPERMESRDKYAMYVEDLMGWATAKRAHTEVIAQLRPGYALNTMDDYMSLWHSVKVNRYPEFISCLDRFATYLKGRIPVSNETIVSYNDKFVALGYLYSRPIHEWETVQILVHFVHEHFHIIGDCITEGQV